MENGFRPTSHESLAGTAGRINQYALVAYIEGKLGDFLLTLRQEIVAGCKLRSHVSILPPRPLAGSEAQAVEFIQIYSHRLAAFEVVLDAIEKFPVTNVTYVSIAAGVADLHATHGIMNAQALQYVEPYAYHPHITLAQDIPEAHQAEALHLCQARWKEFTGPRHFPVETLTFVQNTMTCGWLDLAAAKLEMAGSRL